jgi:hypothetical protein
MNPILEAGDIPSNGASRLPAGTGDIAQCVTDTKFSTKTLAAAVWPAVTAFFTTQMVADPTLDYYDSAGQIVTSAKMFMIQAIAVNLRGGAIVDLDAIVNLGVIVLTSQQKEVGRLRLRHLCAAGGLYIAGAQAAAAAVYGVTNGEPQNEPFRINELLLQTNQTFKVELWGPITTPYTITVAVNVEVDLMGYEIRPTA